MSFKASKYGKMTVTLGHFDLRSFWGNQPFQKMSRITSLADKYKLELEENTPKYHSRPPHAASPMCNFANALQTSSPHSPDYPNIFLGLFWSNQVMAGYIK